MSQQAMSMPDLMQGCPLSCVHRAIEHELQRVLADEIWPARDAGANAIDTQASKTASDNLAVARDAFVSIDANDGTAEDSRFCRQTICIPFV
jgi:hypothetical protein